MPACFLTLSECLPALPETHFQKTAHPHPYPRELSVANKGLTAISCVSVANKGLSEKQIRKARPYASRCFCWEDTFKLGGGVWSAVFSASSQRTRRLCVERSRLFRLFLNPKKCTIMHFSPKIASNMHYNALFQRTSSYAAQLSTLNYELSTVFSYENISRISSYRLNGAIK